MRTPYAALVLLHAGVLSLLVTPPDPAGQISACKNLLNVKPGQFYFLTGDETYHCADISGWVFTGPHTLTIERFGGLKIQRGGEINVDGSGGTLLLSGGGSHRVDGEVFLLASNAALHVTADTLLKGMGTVSGHNDDALVKIEPGRTLTNGLGNVGFVGHMQIKGLLDPGSGTRGVFRNRGQVRAVGGVLELCPETDLEDLANVEGWRVAPGSTLRFSRYAPHLSGDFRVDGTLRVDQSVTTSGSLTCSGTILVAANRQFCYDDAGQVCIPDPIQGTTFNHHCP